MPAATAGMMDHYHDTAWLNIAAGLGLVADEVALKTAVVSLYDENRGAELSEAVAVTVVTMFQYSPPLIGVISKGGLPVDDSAMMVYSKMLFVDVPDVVEDSGAVLRSGCWSVGAR